MYKIKEIEAVHDKEICEIIKEVGAQYGAVGEGFGPSDLEVLNMSQHYKKEEGSIYLIAIINNKVVGGAGISSFNDKKKICELRKLFLLPESQKMGIGKDLLQRCLAFAKKEGYKECYLDTLSSMGSAIKLYEKNGFKHLSEPLGDAIHDGCDVWMLKEL
ncbi:MAG: GNAT family N-acetyltransferase [Psychrilyobacter sp.]|uniref:GNAT family N-acetyltransferase n=1 Tax=Psychrilyobacter sp. TaxID=2586924 RepID=UPI003C7423DD